MTPAMTTVGDGYERMFAMATSSGCPLERTSL